MAAGEATSIGSPKRRSRITRGSKLLPSVHEQSVWARVVRDVLDAAGGALRGRGITELQRTQARRIAALEAELIHIEDRIARAHAAGDDPAPADLDLYGRLAHGQRRYCEALGWQREQRDVTHTVIEVIRQKAREKATEARTPEERGDDG